MNQKHNFISSDQSELTTQENIHIQPSLCEEHENQDLQKNQSQKAKSTEDIKLTQLPKNIRESQQNEEIKIDTNESILQERINLETQERSEEQIEDKLQVQNQQVNEYQIQKFWKQTYIINYIFQFLQNNDIAILQQVNRFFYQYRYTFRELKIQVYEEN